MNAVPDHALARLSSAGNTGRGHVTERVVDAILDFIETNALAAGDKLPPERVFIDMLGVSRTSLREALRVLATVGVIDVRHGDGMYVMSPKPVYTGSKVVFDATEQFALRNLIETRRGIEVTAVAAAIERGADEDFIALEAMLDEQQRALNHEKKFVWDPLHFELAVVEITGNSWLYDVELMLRDSWATLSSGLRGSVGRYSEWHAEHRAILASLRSRNVKQAQRLVITHLSLERFEQDLMSRGTAAAASADSDNT